MARTGIIFRKHPGKMVVTREKLKANEGGLDEDSGILGDPFEGRIKRFINPDDFVDLRTEDVEAFENAILTKVWGEKLIQAGKIAEAIAFYQEAMGDVPRELVERRVQELVSLPAKEDDSGLTAYYQGRDLEHCEVCGRKLGSNVWVAGEKKIDGFLWVAPRNGKRIVVLGCRACADKIRANGWMVWEAFNRIGRPHKENWSAAYEKLAELSGKVRRIGGELIPGSWIPIPKNLKGKRVESATARFDQFEQAQVFGGIR